MCPSPGPRTSSGDGCAFYGEYRCRRNAGSSGHDLSIRAAIIAEYRLRAHNYIVNKIFWRGSDEEEISTTPERSRPASDPASCHL